jgi:hypothetical protein
VTEFSCMKSQKSARKMKVPYVVTKKFRIISVNSDFMKKYAVNGERKLEPANDRLVFFEEITRDDISLNL